MFLKCFLKKAVLKKWFKHMTSWVQYDSKHFACKDSSQDFSMKLPNDPIDHNVIHYLCLGVDDFLDELELL